LLLNTDIALGHISSKYNLDNINEGFLGQMITKCCEKITHIILDNKGLGKEKQRILNLINKSDLEILKL
jgi:D-tyrosyl-tRNA(Tyr) deacylase